ncbi:YjjG family noncanonical pyrimidine nucleotidase [Marinilongibacter aquaticus]|uniref:YjjG family noncanonical pyrimidine nucleotidase n=1 Tax=Marinilongibacter aquaticus TaxID=2975157 RepID=UPI0021BD7936|nr:YjjG family noncanonical pyrimidine nucleotidase [Marinilongibacter aquaticus]UBM58117.1 YjjG family noncanonical pyrimidine nucleotidase [Marinilongibacter aquaticus]
MFTHKKHIFFDLDHTLWDFDANATHALTLIYQSADWQASGLDLSLFIEKFSEENKKLWTKLELEQISHEDLRATRFQLALGLLDVEIDTEESLRLNGLFLELLPEQNKLIEGCIAILESLKPRYELHILSNGYFDVQCKKIQSGGIAHYFKHIITNDIAASRKPDLGIFTYAQNKTSAKAEESLMIGDSLIADVQGAKNAGWDAIHFSPKAESEEHLTISKLEELLQYL